MRKKTPLEMASILKIPQYLFWDGIPLDQTFVNCPADEKWQRKAARITNVDLPVRSMMKFVDAISQLEGVDPSVLPSLKLPAQLVERLSKFRLVRKTA
jgi:hypothetical protein